MKQTLSRAYTFLLDLLFPVSCQSCGGEGEYLCLTCQGRLEPPPARCLACGKTSPVGQIHLQCRSRDAHLAGLLVAADYHSEAVRNLIWYFKYSAVRGIADTLSQLLVDHLARLDLLDYFQSATVIPVPLYRKKLKQRGYNQAALLAEGVAKRLNCQYLPILEKTKPTVRQVDLPREARFLNVTGSFAAIPLPSLGERKILLVDDVATTGATLNECAKVLAEQGAGETWALVVARN